MTRFLNSANFRHAIPVNEIKRINFDEQTVAQLKNGDRFDVHHQAVEELSAIYVPASAGQTVWVAHYHALHDEGVDSVDNDAPNGMFVYEAPVVAWRLVRGAADPVLPDGVLDSETSDGASTTRWAMQTVNGTVVDCVGSVFSSLESFRKDYLADRRRQEAKRVARS